MRSSCECTHLTTPSSLVQWSMSLESRCNKGKPMSSVNARDDCAVAVTSLKAGDPTKVSSACTIANVAGSETDDRVSI